MNVGEGKGLGERKRPASSIYDGILSLVATGSGAFMGGKGKERVCVDTAYRHDLAVEQHQRYCTANLLLFPEGRKKKTGNSNVRRLMLTSS